MASPLFITFFLGIIVSVKTDVYNEYAKTNCLANGGSCACGKGRNCHFLAGLDYNSTTNELNVLLYVSDGDKYIALGLSDDSQMGDDDVIACFKTHTDVVVYYGRTFGHMGVTTSQPGVNAITTLAASNMEVTKHSLYCHWKLLVSSLPRDFKFKAFEQKETYYLFVATGPVTWSSPNNKYELAFHRSDYALSSEKINFGEINEVRTALPEHLERKIHIFCMTWAWMFFMPVGILTARYYKETWAKVRICRRRLWFMFHVAMMLLGLVFFFIGYVPILIKNKRSFQNPLHFKGLPVHQWIGFTAGVLYVLQVIPNWFHIIGNPTLRCFISGFHTFLGITCYVLGFFNIATAHIFTAEVLPLENNLQYVAIISISILLFYFLFLSATYSWIDSHMGIDIRRAFCYWPMPISSNEEAPRPGYRKIILCTFIVLAFVLSTINVVFMFTWAGFA